MTPDQSKVQSEGQPNKSDYPDTQPGIQPETQFPAQSDPTEVTAEGALSNLADLPEHHTAFLEKVMLNGSISDPYDARDLTNLVFRIMRDLMTTEASDRVKAELHEEAVAPETTDVKALQELEVSDLWGDTNPIVGLLSRVRPPWQGPGIFKIDSDRFLFRVANEGGLPPDRNAEQVVKAVFGATKDQLSAERIREVAEWMPEGTVATLWNEA